MTSEKPKPPLNLGGKIKNLLRERGTTPAELAEIVMEMGKDRATVYRILEGNTKDPRIETLTTVTRGLGGNPDADLKYLLDPEAPTDALGIEIHQTFQELAALKKPDQKLAGRILRAAVTALTASKASKISQGPR